MKKNLKYNQASLLVHALIDNLDNSHFMYDKESGKLQFNVGKVARNSKFSHIEFLIRRSEKDAVRPAKMRSGDKFSIVVDTQNFPDIKDVDQFLESSNISSNVIEALAVILDKVPPMDDGDSSSKTSYEKEKHYNQREVFEDTYQQAVRKMKEQLETFEKSKKEFEEKIENSGIASRKATYKLAIQNLKKEMLGENASQFKSIFMKLIDEIDPNFRESLDADNRKRLNSRIEQFYSEIS